MSDPEAEQRWMPGADGQMVERFDDNDVDKLAQILHGLMPEIERKLFGAPTGFVEKWDNAAQLTQEGKRLQARYLLERNLIHLKALRA